MSRAATFVGLVVLAGLVAAIAAFVPDEQLRRPMWVFIYLAIAAAALFVWNHPEAPKAAMGWPHRAGASVLVAAALFALDGVIGLVRDPKLSFIDAMTSNGSSFVLNFFVAPCLTFIALAGWARSLLLPKPETPNPTAESDVRKSSARGSP